MPDHVNIVFALYPGMTQLYFAGPYEVFCRLPDATVTIASVNGGELRTQFGLTFAHLARLAAVDRCSILCVPGGTNLPITPEDPFLAEVRRLAAQASFVTSVCNGSLILGAAGLLSGVRSTSHWGTLTELSKYGAIPVAERVVRDGRIVTGGGVTAGIDFALTLAAELAGPTNAQVIQLLIEYAPAPPFNSGHPTTAPVEVMRALEGLMSQET